MPSGSRDGEHAEVRFWDIDAPCWSLDEAITRPFPSPRRQLELLYGEGAFEAAWGRVQAFRSMHLHGRALNALLPVAIADLDDPEVRARGVDAFGRFWTAS